jgi:hypothetical protein
MLTQRSSPTPAPRLSDVILPGISGGILFFLLQAAGVL